MNEGLLSDFGHLLLALALVLLNGFFVAAEFAIVKVRGTRMRELAAEGSWRARVVQRIQENLDAYLSATQLGITLASLGLGWIGEPAFAHLISPLLTWMGVESPATLHAISLTVAFVTISFLHIVIGELAPKSMAIWRPEPTSLWIAWPLRMFYYLMWPAIMALNSAATFILGIFGLKPEPGHHEAPHSEEELRMIVASSHAQGVLNATERAILENVFEFSDRRVTQIMVPRTEMVCLYTNHTLQENLDIVRQQLHTRYPLADQEKDHIVGMIHVKDLLRAAQQGQTVDFNQLKRTILFVPQSVTIDKLLKIFQKQRCHLAVVVDEYGGIDGMVTLENVLEELVGDIHDEFDLEAPDIQEQGDHVMVDPGLPLIEAADTFGFEIAQSDDSINSLGGYVLKLLGRVPRVGEAVTIGRYRVEVTQMDGLRLAQLRFRPVALAGAKPSQEATR